MTCSVASTKHQASMLYCWKQNKGKSRVCLPKHVRSHTLLQKAKHTSFTQLLHQVIRHLLQLFICITVMLPDLSRLSQPENRDSLKSLRSLFSYQKEMLTERGKNVPVSSESLTRGSLHTHRQRLRPKELIVSTGKGAQPTNRK